MRTELRSLRHAAVIVLCAVALTPTSRVLADEAAVRAAVDRFYSALNSMFTGELTPMMEVWSHADDVTYMGPGGGFRVGWQQVLADWRAQADLKLGGEVEPKDVRFTVGDDIAVTSNYEVGRSVVDGKVETLTIRPTNIFRLEDGRWKMIGHHTDLLPYLEK